MNILIDRTRIYSSRERNIRWAARIIACHMTRQSHAHRRVFRHLCLSVRYDNAGILSMEYQILIRFRRSAVIHF